MTRLLVVHPDPLVVWDRAAALEHAGYEVETCFGPSDADCPVLEDQPCPLLDRADALVYDARLGSPPEMRFLTSRLRDTYSDLPLIVIGDERDTRWTEPVGSHRVWRMPTDGTLAQLSALIEEALTEQGMAV